MGWKFRKSRRSIKILPGIRLNTGKKGITSISIGGGKKFRATTNINLKTGKTKTTYSLRGIGSIEWKPKRSNQAAQKNRQTYQPNTNKSYIPPSIPSTPHSQFQQKAATRSAHHWYQKNWVIILFMVFLPALSLPLIWVGKWPRRQKMIGTGVAAFWLILLLITGSEETPQPEPSNPPPEISQVETAPPAKLEESRQSNSQVSVNDPSWETIYQDALKLAASAESLADSAFTPDDWQLVESRLDRSIQLLQSIPESDSNYSSAQSAIKEASLRLTFAKKGQRMTADTFSLAINVAMEAANLTQTAQLTSEWENIVALWQESIDLLKLVPGDSPNYQTAQAKIVEYGKNLEYAQKQIDSVTSAPSSQDPSYTQARASRSGSCDCPYDRDSKSRRCGSKSAYSRPGGSSPVCYVLAE